MYFKQCPFCEAVFDIGATEHQLMEVHIAEKHRHNEREETTKVAWSTTVDDKLSSADVHARLGAVVEFDMWG